MEAVKAALRRGQYHPNILLQAAVCAGHIGAVVALLLDPRIDVNATTVPDRWTSLHLACIYGHGNLVRALVAHPGVQHSLQDSHGNTPLAVAVVKKREECARILVQVPGVLDFDFLIVDNLTKSQFKVFRVIEEAKEKRDKERRPAPGGSLGGSGGQRGRQRGWWNCGRRGSRF